MTETERLEDLIKLQNFASKIKETVHLFNEQIDEIYKTRGFSGDLEIKLETYPTDVTCKNGAVRKTQHLYAEVLINLI